MALEREWIYTAAGKREGPLSALEIAALISRDELPPRILVWKRGMAVWIPASDVPEIATHLGPLEPDLHAPVRRDAATRTAQRHAVHSDRRPRSYLRRHWAGDLSLGVSFWLNGTLVTLMSAGVAMAAGRAFGTMTYSPALIWFLVSGVWTTVLAATLWQLVGVWRSAGKHKERGGKAFWAGTARFMVVLGLLRVAVDVRTSAIPQLFEISRRMIAADVSPTFASRVLTTKSHDMRPSPDELVHAGVITSAAPIADVAVADAAVAHSETPGPIARDSSLPSREVAGPDGRTGALSGEGARPLRPPREPSTAPTPEPTNVDVQAGLGRSYELGRGVPQDFVRAAYWYRKAAEQGSPSAQFSLGRMYYNGRGVSQDFAQAADWYRKAAGAGARWSGDSGSALAQNSLGAMYENGQGVQVDLAQAARFYAEASRQGLAQAEENLARVRLRSTSPDVGPRAAAADGKYRDSCNSAEAEPLDSAYRASAEQGSAIGENWVGRMYETGRCAPHDPAQAAWWYGRAAEQGHAPSQRRLSMLFEAGRGVRRDLTLAYKWMALASVGDPGAAVEVRRLVAKMTPQEIEVGERLAASWKAEASRRTR